MNKVKNFFKNCPEVLSFLLFIIGGVAVVMFTNNFFGLFSPFIIAYIITKILRPLMVKIDKKIKLPRLITTLLCLLIFVAIAGIIIWVFSLCIVDGIEYVIDLISTYTNGDDLSKYIQMLENTLAKLSETFDIQIDLNAITNEFYNVVKTVIKTLSSISIKLVISFPDMLVTFIIGSLAAFYMLYDYDKIAIFINRQLSPKTKHVLEAFNNDVLSSFFKMIFSYILISVICFIELGIGFFVLDIKDAWFIALIIAIVDVFPIVGSGGILVPWGIIALIFGNPVKGIGLMVLWGIIVIVRQIVEPKLVGSQIGLHPLITIMAMYIGLS